MKHFVKDVKSYAHYIIYATQKKLKAEVANSYLNWVWWVLEPFCEMLIFTFVFGTLLGNRTKDYPVYIYSGLITWKFFSQTLTYSVSLMRIRKGIITKVYVPKFIFLLENMCLNGFKFLISFGVLVVMMIVLSVSIRWEILYVLPVYGVLLLITFSWGVVLMHFGVFMDDLSHIITILLRLLFYVSGIFYNIDNSFPENTARIIKFLNPMAAIMEAMHDALFEGKISQGSALVLWTIAALGISAVGIKIVYKYENSYVKVI